MFLLLSSGTIYQGFFPGHFLANQQDMYLRGHGQARLGAHFGLRQGSARVNNCWRSLASIGVWSSSCRRAQKFQAFFDLFNGCVVIVGDRLVVHPGVNQGGAQLLVPQELLDRGDAAAGVEQLGGRGVAQPVRIGVHPHLFPGRFDALAHQVLAHRLVAVQENVVGWSRPAYRQVFPQRSHGGIRHVDGAVLHSLAIAHAQPAPVQVQVFLAQFFHLPTRSPLCQSR